MPVPFVPSRPVRIVGVGSCLGAPIFGPAAGPRALRALGLLFLLRVRPLAAVLFFLLRILGLVPQLAASLQGLGLVPGCLPCHQRLTRIQRTCTHQRLRQTTPQTAHHQLPSLSVQNWRSTCA